MEINLEIPEKLLFLLTTKKRYKVLDGICDISIFNYIDWSIPCKIHMLVISVILENMDY